MKNKEKYWFLICAHHLHMGIEHESTCFATAFPVAFTHHMKFTARYIFMMAVRVSNVRASVCLMRTFLGNLFLRLHISATDTAAQPTACLPAATKHEKHNISRADDFPSSICLPICSIYSLRKNTHTLLVISVINFRVTFPIFFFCSSSSPYLFIYFSFFDACLLAHSYARK